MVCKSGKELWQKIDELGPKVKCQRIPEQVIIDGNIISDINLVLKEWESKFSELYTGVLTGTSGFDDDFLNSKRIESHSIDSNSKSQLDSSYLNVAITINEVKTAVKEAKNGKSVSVDKLPNEIFKNTSSTECLTDMFNFCFKNSCVPKVWCQSVIAPIYKGKGKERLDPISYRPISLISNTCKIFSNILNKRLLTYLECNDLLVEEQNGFRTGRSCEEHVFVLNSIIIRQNLNEKRPVFGCFMDFSSAFDFLNRDLLHYALKNIGINNEFLNIMTALYKKTECTIKINDKVTDWFQTYAGIKQGQNDSPTQFAIYANSLAEDKIIGSGDKNRRHSNMFINVRR